MISSVVSAVMTELPEKVRQHYRVPRGPVIDVQVHGKYITITRINMRVIPIRDRWALDKRWQLISSGRVLWPEEVAE